MNGGRNKGRTDNHSSQVQVESQQVPVATKQASSPKAQPVVLEKHREQMIEAGSRAHVRALAEKPRLG